MCIGSHASSRRRHVAVRFLDHSSILVISMEFASIHRSGIRNLEVASTFLWTPNYLRYFCYVYDCSPRCCVERDYVGVQTVNKFVDGRYRY